MLAGKYQRSRQPGRRERRLPRALRAAHRLGPRQRPPGRAARHALAGDQQRRHDPRHRRLRRLPGRRQDHASASWTRSSSSRRASGDVFLLGSNIWRVLEITDDRVMVGEPPAPCRACRSGTATTPGGPTSWASGSAASAREVSATADRGRRQTIDRADPLAAERLCPGRELGPQPARARAAASSMRSASSRPTRTIVAESSTMPWASRGWSSTRPSADASTAPGARAAQRPAGADRCRGRDAGQRRRHPLPLPEPGRACRPLDMLRS